MTEWIAAFDALAPWQRHGLAVLLGYLLGSIPFGLLLTRWAGLGDVRKIGSGNIGATNVLRTGRKGLAAATLLMDVAKGSAAVLIAGLAADPLAALIAGIAAFLGHLFPIWLRFAGGKGVATALGVMLGWSWPVGVGVMLVWTATVALSRISSLGGLIAAASAPVLMVLMGKTGHVVPTIAIAALILLRHKDNIARLIRGEEPRIGDPRDPR